MYNVMECGVSAPNNDRFKQLDFIKICNESKKTPRLDKLYNSFRSAVFFIIEVA